MVSKLPTEFQRYVKNCSQLQRIFNDAQKSLDEITAAAIFPNDDLKGEVLTVTVLNRLTSVIASHPSIVILGQSCQAKALLVNALFGQQILPLTGKDWRWLRFTHCITTRADCDVMEEIPLQESICFSTLSEQELARNLSYDNCCDNSMLVEIPACHPLLKHGVQINILPDSNDSSIFKSVLTKGLENVLPVILYAIAEDSLTDENINELRDLKQVFPELPVFFICTRQELTEAEQHQLQENSVNLETHLESFVQHPTECVDKNMFGLVHQLSSIGYLHFEGMHTKETNITTRPCCGQLSVGSDFVDGLHKLDQLLLFVRGYLQFHLIQVSSLLNDIHSQCLRRFILSAFDMAREIQITPRRIQYAQEKEADLYNSLMAISSEKQEEIAYIIQLTVEEMRESLVEKAAGYCYHGVTVSESEEVRSQQDITIATTEIHHLVLSRLSNAVAVQIVNSVACLQDTFVGTLQRCLESLEKNSSELDGSSSASDALKQILSAAYNVEVTTSASSSFVQMFLERLRKLLYTFHLPWRGTKRLDVAWRKRVATEMLDSLSSVKLAKTISAQFRDKVRASHEAFQSAIRNLECHYSGHLERTEEQRVAIRKHHAPRLARLALESTSMCDLVRYGMPVQGKEIGRGQYGVVFSCESWGGAGPCAVKSVVPPDDKHWNDLAMEFYYTRTIPEHKNIVKLRGSVVDHTYGGGMPAVLLIMDRLARDLYCGLRSGLTWLVRIQIAIDVAEGIRYLHSQGLVHRDIKLKNVLLDGQNRAKLTDLGFCIPEAMMSGSIVGTPVHMAPELLSGHYDSSVDVYAFGILFWYICAGHVRLPFKFEQFHSKEQLWCGVKKGTRPERLKCFNDRCWDLMEQCWSAEPARRPLLGYIHPVLQSVKSEILQNSTDTGPAVSEISHQ